MKMRVSVLLVFIAILFAFCVSEGAFPVYQQPLILLTLLKTETLIINNDNWLGFGQGRGYGQGGMGMMRGGGYGNNGYGGGRGMNSMRGMGGMRGYGGRQSGYGRGIIFNMVLSLWVCSLKAWERPRSVMNGNQLFSRVPFAVSKEKCHPQPGWYPLSIEFFFNIWRRDYNSFTWTNALFALSRYHFTILYIREPARKVSCSYVTDWTRDIWGEEFHALR